MLTKKALIYTFIKDNKGVSLGSLSFGFLSILSTIFIPLFLGKFYQLALRTHSARGTVFDKLFGQIKDINKYFLLFGILIVLKFIFDYFYKYFSGISGELFSKALREQLFSKQMHTFLDVHHTKETGMYLLRYSGDLSCIQSYLTKGILSFAKDCMFMLLALGLLVLINLQLALIVIILFPIIFSGVILVNKNLKIYTIARRNIRSQNLSFVSTRLNALLTVKIFNRETIETEKFGKKSKALFENGKKYYGWYALLNGLLPFLLYTMLGVVLKYAYSINHGGFNFFDLGDKKGISGSVILIFILQMVNFIPSMKRILSVNLVWQKGDVSIEKFLKIFNRGEEIKDKTEYPEFETGTIVFDEVSFGFSEEKKLIQTLSFVCPQNGLTYVEGAQGSGKSTLFKLIAGIYQAQKGKILVNGQDIAAMSKHTLRKNVTMVSNELPLIGKTLFEAISYSRKEEKRAAAFEMLHLLGFTNDNNEGILNKPLLDGGRNYSAGERKILLLARALLTRKKLILLDEPFADLDPSFKIKLVALLNDLKASHSILIIDKNKEKLLHYDQTINLDKVEQTIQSLSA